MSSLLKLALFRPTALSAFTRPAAVRFCNSKVPSDASADQLESATPEAKLGGFAKAFEKHSAPQTDTGVVEPPKTFASLLRNSKFMDVRFLS